MGLRVLLLSFFLFTSCKKSEPAYSSSAFLHRGDPYEGNVNAPSLNISTLVKHHTEGLIFKTEAYVVFIYQCPKCPKGAQCKPCMEDNIVISEKAGDFKDYNDLNSSRMIVYLSDPKILNVGGKYRFLLKYESVDFDEVKNTIWKGRLINFESLSNQ